MTDEELKKLWANTIRGESVTYDKERLCGELDTMLKKLDGDIKARNKREQIAAWTIMAIFMTAVFFVHPLLSRIGALVLVVYGGVVIYMLSHVRQLRPVDTSLTLKEYLVPYRAYITHERSLLKNIVWWYIAPAVAGLSLWFAGFHQFTGIVLVVVMSIAVYYLNKRAVRQYFDPLLKHIDEEIKAFAEQ